MELPDWVPATMDVSKPSSARMYDYYLGGTHNFEVDREAAERAIAVMPFTIHGARGNRDFLRRAVRHLVESGVTQLLDLGSGIPTVGNVHEVAQRVNPLTRTVYVDIDPVAVAHSTAILRSNPLATVIHADMRDTEAVLAHPDVRRLIDFSEPVGVIMAAVLHFVPESSDPDSIIARYREAVPDGSQLVLSHMSLTGQPAEMLERFPGRLRQHHQPGGLPQSRAHRRAVRGLRAGGAGAGVPTGVAARRRPGQPGEPHAHSGLRRGRPQEELNSRQSRVAVRSPRVHQTRLVCAYPRARPPPHTSGRS